MKSLGPEQFLLNLLVNVFADLSARYPQCRKSFCRDIETVRSRFSSEGIQFLTKTLPKLGKSFDRALVNGQLNGFDGFRPSKSGRYPAFVQGLFSQLFDECGILVADIPSVIKDIRQVCYLVYKAEFPYTDEDEMRVVTRFVSTDAGLCSVSPSANLTLARRIIAEVLEGFNPREILPRHGPGSVATGEKGDAKWEFSHFYPSLHWWYPYDDYFTVGGENECVDRDWWFHKLERDDSPQAKVTLVPKDSRGPRLISMEPLEYQWIQQGIMRALVPHLENSVLCGGRINFTSQHVNRELAKTSSVNGVYSTLDMKDASDRVSLELVEYLFPRKIFNYLNAARSHSTKLPNGDVITLKKFAPMGSAICFPVEALVFWAISLAALSLRSGVLFQNCADLVYVYGDDIIVPTHYVDEVMSALEAADMEVNREKSCTAGHFRESCGMDAYNGIDVTPLKVSTLWSTNPRSGTCLASYSSYANELAERGFDAAATFVRDHLTRQFGVLPRATSSFGGPCCSVESVSIALSANQSTKKVEQRFNRAIQQYEIRCKCIEARSSESSVDGWPRLLRNMSFESSPVNDRVVHRGCTLIRWKWLTLRS